MAPPSLFSLLKKRPKTGFVAITAISTAVYWTYDVQMTNDVMKYTCQHAARLGDERLGSTARPRHITVILNPVANKRKSKKLYTKWVEPILHLAGIKVSLVETESPNQAYDLMKIMSNCDGVAIVGGDGTVNEALNGLLSRPDCVKAAKDYPIAIMPAGQNNSIARYIHQNLLYRNQKEFLIQATSRLIDSVTEKHDVLKIVPMKQGEEEDNNNEEKHIYALRDIRYGKYQDNYFKLSGFLLYQTYLKPYWYRIQKIFNNKCPIPQIDSIDYTEPCEGCSRCYERHLLKSKEPLEVEQQQQSANRRWWGLFAPVAKSKISEEEEMAKRRELELSKRDNPNCDKWKQIDFPNEVTDFRASQMSYKKVRLSLSRGGEFKLSEVLETQDVRLKVSRELDNEKLLASQRKKDLDTSLEADEVKSEEAKKDDKSIQFLIDGQPNQAHSVEITSLKEAVTIFTGPMKLY